MSTEEGVVAALHLQGLVAVAAAADLDLVV